MAEYILAGQTVADPTEIAHATELATAQLSTHARPWVLATTATPPTDAGDARTCGFGTDVPGPATGWAGVGRPVAKRTWEYQMTVLMAASAQASRAHPLALMTHSSSRLPSRDAGRRP